MRNDESLFNVNVADVQERASSTIGRELTDEELYQVSKGLSWGLGSGLDIVLDAAIEEATKEES